VNQQSPATGHSAESLTRLAIDITCESGLDGLTVRALARRAGVYPAVVYHHLGDLDQVHFTVADAVVGMIDIPSSDGVTWREWLLELAERGYEVIARHPGVFRYIARNGPSSPNQVRMIDATMQVLSRAGLGDEDASYTYGAYINHVGGAADLAAMSALDADRHEVVVERFQRNLGNVAALHPGLQRAVPTFVTWDHERAFRFALDLLLDGIDRRLARREQPCSTT
jgi:AcrR family transcriptional regulator